MDARWCPVCSIGSKWLRRFDIREGTHNNFSNARGAYSLTVDPNRTNSFASYSRADHQIKIWDMRQFSDPVTTIMTGARETVTQLAWSPTRTGLLAALVENETAVPPAPRPPHTHTTHTPPPHTAAAVTVSEHDPES